MRRFAAWIVLGACLVGTARGEEPMPAAEKEELRGFVSALRAAEVLSVFPRPGETLAQTLRRRGIDEDTALMVEGLLDGDVDFGQLRREDRIVLSLLRPKPDSPPELLALQLRGLGGRLRTIVRDDDGGFGVFAEENPTAIEVAVATGTAKANLRSAFPLPLRQNRPAFDLARLGQPAQTPVYAPSGRSHGLARPIGRARMSSGFGWRIHPVLRDTRFHHGADFAAPTGTPVFAAANGRIAAMEWRGNYGRYVKIDHGDGLSTAYAHLGGFALGLTTNTLVRQGQVIGYVGATGLATGPHLYFEVRVDERPIDPLVAIGEDADD